MQALLALLIGIVIVFACVATFFLCSFGLLALVNKLEGN